MGQMNGDDDSSPSVSGLGKLDGSFWPGISFQSLGCHGTLASDPFQDTVISYALALPRRIVKAVLLRPSMKVQILQDLDGTVRSGEMLLVLGRPGSGCSTFLKTLAGNTHGFTIDDGTSITYDGIPYTAIHSMKNGNCIYLSENDVHFPELTVGQTLEFAAATRGEELICGAVNHEVARSIASTFNLDKAYGTKLGNAMIRGVSGGEKRRTSLAEAFISRARFQCWDNSTRGLDSATSSDFVKLLRDATNSGKSSVIMSIYQASEEVYRTFDKVTVLYKGRQIYFGPVDAASNYFTSLGFERPNSATTADFLTSLTNPAERIVRPGFEKRVPNSPDEFAKAWKHSTEAIALLGNIQRNGSEPAQEQSGKPEGYRADYTRQENSEGFARLRNNYVPVIAGIFANTIIAIVVGSVFFNLGQSTDSMDKRAVLLFFSLMITAFAPAFEIITMWAQRPIVDKHSRYGFYHPYTESLASAICDVPNKLATSLLFHTTLYFMTDLRRTAAGFFTYYVFSLFVLLTMSMLFRMIGSLSKTLEQTMAPVSIMVVVFIAYTGFVLPIDYMVGWLSWLRWINPLAYAYESLMINEFHGRSFTCSNFVPNGPLYDAGGLQGKTCTAIGASEGERDVQGTSYLALKYGFIPEHLWRNLAIICSMMVIFCAIYLMASEYVRTEESKGDILVFNKGASMAVAMNQDCEAAPTRTFPDDIREMDMETHADAPLPTQTAHERGSPVLFWKHLNYDIKARKKSRCILRNLNGWVRPGTLTVLMGVTGAGKTTLLDLLAHRPTSGIRSGRIYVGDKLCDETFQRKLGYVQQEDVHLPTATVREALIFSALLRQPEEKSPKEIERYVDQVIRTLEMDAYSGAVVGVPGDGLNLEQRKRLTIAVEMVTKPESFLFLDEPMSGLDSQTAWSICNLLHKLRDSGQAILCTVHQPSSRVFQMFDRLLLLSNAGEMIYFGDIGYEARTMIRYFEGTGAAKCGIGDNPAEWMMQVIKTSPHLDGNCSRSTQLTWPEKWTSSVQNEHVTRQLEEMEKSSTQLEDKPAIPGIRQPEYAASLTRQILTVSKRMFQNYWRNPTYLYSKMALCVGVSLANGLSFDRPLGIQGLTSSLFSIFLLTQLFSTIDQQVIPRLTNARELFESREQPSKAYSWVTFLSSTIMVEIIWQTLSSVLIFVCWYYPTGLWRNSDATFSAAERGALTFVLIWLFGLWITTFSQLVAVGIEHAETAVQIATLFFWLSLVFCGVIVSPSDLPGFWVFVYRASPLTYFVNGLAVAGLANMRIVCSSVEMMHLLPTLPSTASTSITCGQYLEPYVTMAGGYIENPGAEDVCLYCPVSDANTVLRSLGMEVNDKWRSAGFMLVYVVFNTLAIFLIYWITRVPRRHQGQVDEKRMNSGG